MFDDNSTEIEIYGNIINDSLKIECAPLVNSLENIAFSFEDYFRLLDKVRFC